MYNSTLTDRENGQSITYRNESIYEVMMQLSMIIEDTNLKKIQIKIIKDEKEKIKKRTENEQAKEK
tara:strand:- start:1217 stop:1414 length:198 start_codon:yes stop_codon:yes gene_type:complete